jgi:hypothetical protein
MNRLVRAILLGVLCLTLGACDRGRGDGPTRQRESNPPSIGLIDIPIEGAVVDASVRVSGWAVDESGVRGVRIFFDDELMCTAPMVTPRPDVERQYPRLATRDGLHGFEVIVDAGAHAGYTVIRAVAIDGKGAQSQVYSVTVKIRE